jgi:uncharacterized membrane protein
MALNFCNQTSTRVWVAIMFHDDDACDEWRREGWWSLNPGECKGVLGLGLFHNEYYYYYAEGDDGRVWEGPYGDVCVSDESFDDCLEYCSTNDYQVGMRQIDIDGVVVDHTVNLTG